MIRTAFLLAIATAAVAALDAPAPIPQPIFYLPLDGSPNAALAGGGRVPRATGHEDPILTLAALQERRFLPSKVGQGYEVGDAPLAFPAAGNFRADEGACGFWLSPGFRGDDLTLYCTFFGVADWGMLYKYQNQSSLTFGTAKPERDLYYDCGVRDISAWAPGQWHHVVATWSRRENARRVYVDGALQATGPFPTHREVRNGLIYVGTGCTLFPGHTAHARMDEFALWDRSLDEAAVRALYDLGQAGKPLWQAAAEPARAAAETGDRLNVVRLAGPDVPAPVRESETRRAVSLDGAWHFLPAAEPLPALPAVGWGQTQVPGYWTDPASTLGPDGQPAGGAWAGKPFADLSVAYYQRALTAPAEWREGSVFLQFEGVDGLAGVFLNGEILGRLPGWEDEAYDVGPRLRYGEENTLTVVLQTRSGSRGAGIYGSVGLRLLPRAFVNDVVVQPRVTEGRIGFSCDVWHAGDPADAELALEITPAAGSGAPAKRFTHRFRLERADRSRAEFSAQAQRVECSFPWPDAHLWTYDDPFLYQVRAHLRAAGAAADTSPWTCFGFREFTRRGSEFRLNGKPTHLRGHQIDLGWSDQMARVQELKAAGMNCFEFSGPVSHDWYTGRYQGRLFEEMLDYADAHGLLAIPNLPDAKVLKERLFEPKVAELYRRRLEKHVRRYGNHPSLAMWYMHFNLAGYAWYIAPSKIDGSYKPDGEGFRQKERYSLEAQRIAAGVDPRPLYHHACGNFGDIYSLNCYIGPSAPLQEREEWPSRWAAQRPFPLVACEHCLLLVPYWFRPRRFPLSEVYAGEPIFDELSAMYLGRHAYSSLTPEIFDLYDVDKAPRGSRMRTLIARHPGYQEVKTIYARHSLRAWRTWGVSGIIFNAENWDFKDGQGNVLPVMRAMARYFGDTDLYVAGPGDDWPSKDHAYYAGERIRKQVVLLNDLTRDLPCTLRWQLLDGAGKAHASGRIQAAARAGQPTFYPIECAAPAVAARTDLHLAVDVVQQPGKHFQPDSFALQAFPVRKPLPPAGKLLLFDTKGRTAKALRQAGVAFEEMREGTDLSEASLLVVGRESWGEGFLALAKKARLEAAIRGGLNVLVLEQTSGSPFGLKLTERSTRQAFVARPGHLALAGLQPEDLADLRGESDLMPSYPDAAPETERGWPARFHKWGNRGVLATYVYTKPQYAPFVPILESGFDLVESPLLEARFGKGRVVLCQVDLTPRLGADPVSDRLLANLLGDLARPGAAPTQPVACVGASAAAFLARFGIETEALDPARSTLIAVGREPLDAAQVAAVEAAARRGATVLLLPGTAEAFGARPREERLFRARVTENPLLAALSDGDLYLKGWATVPAIPRAGRWEPLTEPGIAAVRPLGRGRLVACLLDPDALGQTRGRVKALRFWNVLLANLGAGRAASGPEAAVPVYEENEWEKLPPYINW